MAAMIFNSTVSPIQQHQHLVNWARDTYLRPVPALPMTSDETNDGKVQTIDSGKNEAVNGGKNVKRKKKAKDDAKNTYKAESVDGFMGKLPLDELLVYIEGKQGSEIPEKQKGQGGEDSSRKEKRRKSKDKEVKEDSASATNATTIGNHQGKSPAAAPQASSQDLTGVKESVKSKSSPKRRKSAGASLTASTPVELSKPAVVSASSSLEDAEEEYLSAEEGVLTTNSLSYCTATSDVNATSDLMMDGANYRADNEDVTLIGANVGEEQEFITVGKTKKKIMAHQVNARTGSVGKANDRRGAGPRFDFPRRSSFEDRGNNAKVPRRPPTVADLIDDIKTETRTSKHPPTFKPKKSPTSERSESLADDAAFHDTTEEMASVAKNGTPSPERTFSYADAAKKSSPQEQSRENSPANMQAPVRSQPATPSPTPAASETVVTAPEASPVVGQKDPVLAVAQGVEGFSFCYDENAKTETPKATNVADNQDSDGGFVLNLAGKTVVFAKGNTAPVTDPRHQKMLDIMAERWKEFMSGTQPIYYKPPQSV